jgi:peptidoglycan L-alanyl-D-glutamate endopeptidase CwlK
MFTSRDLAHLADKPRKAAEQMIAVAKLNRIELLITRTYSDYECQAELYKIGRTTEISRKPVTNAAAGESWHNFRCAWDVVPLIGGKCVWDDLALWDDVVSHARKLGIQCGADFKRFPDLCHFQLLPSPTLTLAAARVLWAESGDVWAQGKI